MQRNVNLTHTPEFCWCTSDQEGRWLFCAPTKQLAICASALLSCAPSQSEPFHSAALNISGGSSFHTDHPQKKPLQRAARPPSAALVPADAGNMSLLQDCRIPPTLHHTAGRSQPTAGARSRSANRLRKPTSLTNRDDGAGCRHHFKRHAAPSHSTSLYRRLCLFYCCYDPAWVCL